MSISSNMLLGDEELEGLARRGDWIYDERLKALLEPAANGKTVAIHLDSGDYAVAENSPSALRALRARQPVGMIMTRIVGPDREDPTLMRILAGRLVARQRK